MKTRVVSVDEFGNGYVVITRDDGTTFGQQFSDLPVHDAPAFERALSEVVADAIARTTPPQAKKKDPAVLAMIGKDSEALP